MIFHQPHNSRSNFNYNAYTYSGTTYAPHFHANLELMVVLQGTTSVTVDGMCKEVTLGQMALVLPNQIHGFTVPAGAKLWVAVFAEGFVPHFAALVQGKRGSTFVFEPTPDVRSLILQQLIQSETSQMMKKACFYAVCDQYLSSVSLDQRPAKSDSVVSEILEWITSHYMQDISLRQAAKVFGYEYHYLSRLLNKGYRISFVELLNSYRVERARELLRTTQLSVTEIMSQSGFQSIRSFNMVFRKVVGCTPSAYRDSLHD